MSDRYLVISSDCHAGLPPEKYRDYLDPQYREIFDVALPIQNEEVKKAAKKFLVDDFRRGYLAADRGNQSRAPMGRGALAQPLAGRVLPDGTREARGHRDRTGAVGGR